MVFKSSLDDDDDLFGPMSIVFVLYSKYIVVWCIVFCLYCSRVCVQVCMGCMGCMVVELGVYAFNPWFIPLHHNP